MSANEWTDLISQLQKKTCQKVEKGFFPRSYWEKKWDIAMSETNKRIRKLVNAEIMEVKNFRIVSGSVTRPVPHYKIICTK